MYIKDRLERDDVLAALWVRGEISNFKWHTSGHLYFTLKDEHSQIKCVMFRSRASGLRFRPENGQTVIVAGAVSVYERDGQYQLYAEEMEPAGVGALHLAFEQLKEKLSKEGLFDADRKRPLPVLPRKVGLITSPTGAAVRDMIHVATRRFPNIHLVLAPASVQGAEAPPSLIRALQDLQRLDGVDVIIIGRGGGSLEELWAFNDESLARAVRNCRVPVVSAVGHETDFTICDFVADLRAATPSAAAELVVPSRSELRGLIEGFRIRLATATRRTVERGRSRLKALATRPVLQRPQGRLLQDRQRVDDLARRAGRSVGRILADRRGALRTLAGRLDALSPLAVLGRGYSITKDAEGRVIRSAAQVADGDAVEILLHHGELFCRVERRRIDV